MGDVVQLKRGRNSAEGIEGKYDLTFAILGLRDALHQAVRSSGLSVEMSSYNFTSMRYDDHGSIGNPETGPLSTPTRFYFHAVKSAYRENSPADVLSLDSHAIKEGILTDVYAYASGGKVRLAIVVPIPEPKRGQITTTLKRALGDHEAAIDYYAFAHDQNK